MISVNNYLEAIQRVDIQKLPEIYQEGHAFFLEAKDWYDQDSTVKESINLYLQKLNQHLRRSDEKAHDLIFIRKFLKMDGQMKTKRELERYIQSLQKAILSKKIRKSSMGARHIAKIQDDLIKQYNQLSEGGKVKVKISESWQSELQSVVEDSVLNGLDQWAIPDTSIPKKSPKLSLFNSMDDIDQAPSADSFRLPGDLGKLLGDLERFELAITLEGDQGGGKTRFSYQLADTFATLGYRLAIFSLEIGRKSGLVRRMREEYLAAENHSSIFITDQLPQGFDTIRQAAKDFDVIIIDSWNKLHVKSAEFDTLRKEFPDTVFIVIFQRTTQGTIRGGTAPLFDAGINLEVVKADDTFVNNYVVATKNRYGVTGIQYSITQQKIINHSKETDHEDEQRE